MPTMDIRDAIDRLPLGSVLPTDDAEGVRASLHCLIGKRAADRLLARTGLVGAFRMPAAELAAAALISRPLAERVVAARNLGLAACGLSTVKVRTPMEIVVALPPGFRTLETEVFLAFAVSPVNTVKATVILAKGGVSYLMMRMADVFTPLLRLGAAAFILAHNHPSGTTNPTPDDIRITHWLTDAGRRLGVELLDHIIVTTTDMTSLLALGVLGNAESTAA
jgi:DNA repair protein RadC